MSVPEALGAVSATTAKAAALVRPVVTPVYVALVWLLNEIASTFSVYVFGTCIGLLLGALSVAALRGSLARADAEATRKAKAASADATKKGTTNGTPPPLPIPPDVLAEALRHLPRWTKEPDVNRASWLNNLLDTLWPHIDTSVSETIKDSVEPLLRTAVPPLVSWIGFEKVTLGPTPPCVGGVKVMGSSSEEVMLELELVLATGLDIILAAYVFGVRMPVRVHDLQLRANVRVTFTPLVDQLPCLGGLEVSLMSLPEHVDLGLTIPPGIDLMSLPGMHSILRFALWKFVSPMLVYPAKMTIPIMPNGGVEPQSTGMIKVGEFCGSGFSSRTKLLGSGISASGMENKSFKQKPSSSFPSMSMVTGTGRYIVQLNTRDSRKITLQSKSSDQPEWDETHHFLTNDDSVLTAVVMTGNLKELGRCEIPIRRLVQDDRAHKVTQLHIPIGDPQLYLTLEPMPREPSSGNPSPTELADIAEDHELALEAHALELATLRVNALDASLRPNPQPDVPVLSCTLQYVPLGVESEVDTGAKGAKAEVNKKPQTNQNKSSKLDSDEDEDERDATKENKKLSQNSKDAPEPRRGILTVVVTRGVRILRESNAFKLPLPCATVTCAGQEYTTEPLVEKTKAPIWDEEFLFFNVAENETMSLSVNNKTAKGEFLGGFDLDVAEVAMNKEIADIYHLQGVANAAQVFVKARFAYMS